MQGPAKQTFISGISVDFEQIAFKQMVGEILEMTSIISSFTENGADPEQLCPTYLRQDKRTTEQEGDSTTEGSDFLNSGRQKKIWKLEEPNTSKSEVRQKRVENKVGQL